ncbi:facilitated trehalose transporter Tret1-like [Daktulosphaira vitifoliae]|uniref:facilitated trehalose transporter Tret1-like n=1 Tax=Daktulosphaira vitifoliae TaxID=58002 RepID=UPI0021AA1E1B|nr:facilitated trehalose transporter Tret1-like [Daktulosphaira vitifoliae]XP_050542464.1 facilitated trehalose transporter Tret1-like [Daktulosphaira vitifoliae]
MGYFKLGCMYSIMYYQIFLTATAVGFSGVMLPLMRSPESSIQVNDEEASWIASLLYMLTPVGNLVFGVIMDKYGRKICMELVYLPLIISYIGMFMAKSIVHIYISRAIVGLSVGGGSAAMNVYICETSPPTYRAFFLSFPAVLTSVGMLLCIAMAKMTTWQISSGILAILNIAGLIILMIFLPESPVWLNQNRRHEEATNVYKWFGSSPIFVEVKKYSETNGKLRITFRTFLSRSVWIPTLLTFLFFFVQTNSGIFIIWSYLTDFTKYLKIPIDPFKMTVLIAICRMITSVVTSFILRNMKRKILTFISATGMSISLALVAIYLKLYDINGVLQDDSTNPLPWLTFICLAAFTIFSAIGLGYLPWSFCAEVFPPHVNGVMTGIMYSLAYVMLFSGVKIFPAAVKQFGFLSVLWVFFGFSAFASLFGIFLMPETVNKTKEEILNNFTKSKRTKNEYLQQSEMCLRKDNLYSISEEIIIKN